MKELLVFLSCLAPLLLVPGCTRREPTPPTPSATQAASNAVSARPSENETRALPTKSGAVLFKLKWPVRSRYTYRVDLDQKSTNALPQFPKPVEQNVTMAMTYAVSVLKETPEQERELEMEFLATRMEVKMAGRLLVTFDSKEVAKNQVENPLAAPFRKMIGSRLHLDMDAQGQVEKVLDYDHWMNEIAGEAPSGGMIGQQFTEQFFRQIADFGRGLPTNAVAVGDSWPYRVDIPAPGLGKIKLDLKVNFTGWEDHQGHHCAVLKSNGTITREASDAAGPTANIALENGRVAGTTWFDPELGVLVESSYDQSQQLKGELPGQPGVKQTIGYTVELGQRLSLALLEAGTR